MNESIKLQSGEWYKKTVPLAIIKHRVVKTDPIYKFIINGNIYIRSDINLKKSLFDNEYFYSLNDITSVNKNTLLTGDQWLQTLQKVYRLNFDLGNAHASSFFPEIVFGSLASKNIFDTMVSNLRPKLASDGTKVLTDFTIQISKGFVQNKLGLETSNIKPFLLNDLSFNLLNTIRTNDTKYKVKPAYISTLDLSLNETHLLESLFSPDSQYLPKNKDGNNILSYYVNLANQTQAIKEIGFGLIVDDVQLSSVDNKDFSISFDKNNQVLNQIIHSERKIYVV